jgi:glycosyltransferase involved in cell wall biosynthesis
VFFGVQARRALRRLRADVVHHHASTPAALGLRALGIPTVLSYAAPIGATGRAPTWGALSPLSELVERAACRRTDRVVAVSRHTEAFLLNRYHVPRRRLTVIPNGVDTVLFKPGASEPTDQRIVCVARISPYKDQATLVAAIARPELAERDLRLILVGPQDDPAYTTYLRQLAEREGVEDRLEIADRMDFDRLPELYRSAAVVAAPSLAEGMPLALLEAMSSGRPVVASAIAQHLEIGPDAGVTFVPAGDPGAMSAAIARLLDDVQARVHAAADARRAAVERYSWDAVAEQFEQLYRDLIG